MTNTLLICIRIICIALFSLATQSHSSVVSKTITPATMTSTAATTATSAATEKASAQSSETPVTRFIAPSQFLQDYNLPKWPAEDSESHKRDVLGTLAAQATRTVKDIDDGILDATMGFAKWAQAPNLLGASFTPERYRLTHDLLNAVHEDSRLINRAANARWGSRRRPALTDSRVQPTLPSGDPHSPSYPSARAASTRLWAHVLSEVFPARRYALMAQAERSASLRLIVGVHYPSDIAEGAKMGEALFKQLLQNDAFKLKLLAAKQEANRIQP